MPQVYLSLGTNTGDRRENMQKMESELSRILEAPLFFSRLMETEPLGMPRGTPWFLNRVVSGHYEADPEQLLAQCQVIEIRLGRPAVHDPGQSRSADIDILLFGDTVIQRTELIIPHARANLRRFCLEGLNQLTPQMIYPGTNLTIQRMYLHMEKSVRRQRIRFDNLPGMEEQ